MLQQWSLGLWMDPGGRKPGNDVIVHLVNHHDDILGDCG